MFPIGSSAVVEPGDPFEGCVFPARFKHLTEVREKLQDLRPLE